MERILGQKDIDALFAATTEQTSGEAIDGAGAYRFNYSHAGQISPDEMRAISTLNDVFARNLMHTLGAWLRTQFQVNLVAGEQLPFAEFVSRLGKPTYVCSVNLEPFDALGVLEMELSLAFPIVDVLLGGVGRVREVREMTEIEEEILHTVVKMLLQELSLAWRAVGLELTYAKRENEGQLSRVMNLGEKTLSVCWEVRMPEAQGVLNLCLPASVLNAILRKLVKEGDRPRRRSAEARARMRELLGQANVATVLQFPVMKLGARELAALEEGALLRLPLPRNSTAELRVGGLLFDRAHAVRSGEHRGAQLEAAPRAQ
ncbi:MAG: FliM/FliN family flagellar motor switch protein [Acidobacteriota bacterium]|nr:FliM/FliN family flagellar motor switch protein [Acidobacteriota bacterium]